jgi:uncharacterized protein
MKKLNNPFELHSYYGPQYFCDRIDEVAILNEALINRKNTIISSLRRLGKTNLLLHWQNSLKSQKKTATIYIDVLHTKSDAEFLQLFVNAAVKAIDKGQGFLQVAIKSFASLKPTITIDQYSGEPSLSFDVQASQRVDKNFTEAFKLLSDEFDTVSIAIDEFQQVQNYETTSQIEAIIRSNNTLYPNLHFVFSGSQEHILADMFSNPKKPLYASTQHVSLGKIGYLISNLLEKNSTTTKNKSLTKLFTKF